MRFTPMVAALLFAATPGPVAGAAPATPAPTSAPAMHAPAGRAARRDAARPKPGLPRTLSEVHIEGEIPVPQVLFITSRDPRRFMDFQHRRYLSSSTRLGGETPLPAWVAVIHGPPVDSRKETPR